MSVPAIDEAAMLSPAQVRSLLERVQEDTESERAVYPFLLSLVSAALHPGEAIGLRAADVTLPEEGFGELLVRGKKSRKVPVTPELAGVLRRWISTPTWGPAIGCFLVSRVGSCRLLPT
ncbi:hypothetical protein O7599_08570 [Streptomyces sp. WMMC500]|uniref:hypothetical protein n=1 Tax=Streptomyces sp. WMMC500 TaxID=3015154 RepID=UPI00248C934C|nr:hypothetical protein [Streptomyces sp. WMMC500]WBB62568.1 hypothetical protein O7599_08570 [Streptomyces sp. WMMC500]